MVRDNGQKTANPKPAPPSSSQPPGDKNGDYVDKGKKHVGDFSPEKDLSDDGGKVDIPDYFEELSGEDCCEESGGLKDALISMMNVDSSAEAMDFPLEIPDDRSSSLAIVPYSADKFVEMLLAWDHQEGFGQVKSCDVGISQNVPSRVGNLSVAKK
ncbi:hypothetical protein GUJ93_ZPchr0009g1889 [Zizania palustris]|uniref:Uncharacterized protein n=1 Tax=Zizania palustris TaxID=103762 RepID=A0A8J5RJN7_ZIZPA|nr:hypothetical protein GUJ93_ZPchr0009g1889 [Zizania palustris]